VVSLFMHCFSETFLMVNQFSASCLIDATDVEVTVGETNIASTYANQASSRYTVMAKKWLSHPTFDGNLDNIGLIYLPVNVNRGPNVDIIYLYLYDPEVSSVFTTYFLNQVVEVAGWGRISQTGAFSATLKYTSVKIMDTATCQTAYGTTTIGSKKACVLSASTTVVQG
jgi:hypothetical protein